ncbi:MAG: hypothetical protein IPM50_07740 [Acidobacteriota bacterium]|nr:MAG: hypothetical protein IPM50_07740 [Acidobacteriota bacterium]
MTAAEIKQYLTELNDELALKDVKGEVALFGGAVMVLVFKTRIATKDVDAIFHPSAEIREAASRIANRHGIDETWLNDGVKGYVVPHSKNVLFHMPHLTVLLPDADYLLAMKALAARSDTEDESDLRFLIDHMALKSANEVFSIIQKYYPKQQIPPRTQYFVEGIFGQ